MLTFVYVRPATQSYVMSVDRFMAVAPNSMDSATPMIGPQESSASVSLKRPRAVRFAQKVAFLERTPVSRLRQSS